jgi:hypothetical protein
MKSLQEEYNDQPKATILVTTRYTPKIDEGGPTTLFTSSVLEGIILNPKIPLVRLLRQVWTG